MTGTFMNLSLALPGRMPPCFGTIVISHLPRFQ